MKTRILVVLAAALVSVAAFAKTDPMSLVPANAVSVGVVHLSELRTSPLSSVLFEHTDDISSRGEGDRFLLEAGLDPKKDVDLLIVALSPRTQLGSEAEVLVIAEGRFNADRLVSALVAHGAQKKTSAGGAYLLLPHEKEGETRNGAAAFPTNQLAIIGTETAVTNALSARMNGGSGFSAASPLGLDMARLDPHATAWALIDVARASRLSKGPQMHHGTGQSHQAFTAAINNLSTVGIWGTDTGDSLKLGAFGLARDEETLQLLEDTIRGGLAAMRLAVKDKSPDMVTVLRRFEVSRTSDAVSISGAIPAESLKKLAAQKHSGK